MADDPRYEEFEGVWILGIPLGIWIEIGIKSGIGVDEIPCSLIKTIIIFCMKTLMRPKMRSI